MRKIAFRNTYGIIVPCLNAEHRGDNPDVKERK
jgi:hypothetical protein